MLLKNVTSQGIYLFAYDTTNNVAKTGDAASISGAISKDGAPEAAFGTANPTEIGGGIYWQPLSQAETNANAIACRWTSTTSSVRIDPVLVLTSGVSLPAVAHSGAGGLLTAGSGAGQLNPSGGAVPVSGTVTLAAGTHTGAAIPTVGSVSSPVTVGTNNDKAGYILDLGQAVPATGNGANTVGDCLNAARAQGFGKWVLNGTTLTLFAPDGTTSVRTFTLDSASSPNQRA